MYIRMCVCFAYIIYVCACVLHISYTYVLGLYVYRTPLCVMCICGLRDSVLYIHIHMPTYVRLCV
jgi:hypothetical protein